MSAAEDLLKEGLEQLGLPFTEGQIASFTAYLRELNKWNRAHNLTGLRDERDMVVKHFLDSLLFLKVLPGEVVSVADVGSGAGFPGIPMKIMRPELSLVLIEPSEKKGVFLRHVRSILQLQGMEVVTVRVETVRDLIVDAAVTRALFSIGDFVKKTKTLLRPGGILVLSKGPKIQQEMKDIKKETMAVHDLELPFSGTIRHLVVVKP